MADGSMWVWIPRYEYSLNSQNKTIAVNFISTSTKTASSGYKIHPAFEDGSSKGKNNNYMNGELDSELAGIWVAKFPAGYAGGNNNVTPVDSGEKYTGTYSNISNIYGTVTSGMLE